MESLGGLTAFVRAVELGSFVGAAQRLRVSPSAIGKSVARLEESLGVRLLNRSTRHLSLTEAGELFYARGRRVVQELEEAQTELLAQREAPQGRLRISSPALGYRMLVPILPEFTRRYPRIELDLDFSDRMVDVIAEGMDAVIRSGDVVDSRLKARTLGSFRLVLVGAPAYFAQHGTPGTPEQLRNHACLFYRFHSNGQVQPWTFEGREGLPALELPGTLTFNNIEALIGAAISGLGIAYLPDFAVGQYLRDGQLQSILDDRLVAGGTFSLLWPGSRQPLPKLRAFVDFLAEHLVLGP
ncbi:LysR family transcriptional regulator [Pseudomonas silvicola]|uniref:LysR family transcriptional regulator n=1 Tax=Pseudomonas sp. RIT-To-2 TaxID=3462541 RepID=UPI00227C084C|nr:LysR family transcriptional regulator [Pseudomonas silvicola]